MTPKEHSQVLELIKTVSNEFKENLTTEIAPLKNDVADIKRDVELMKLWREKQEGLHEGRLSVSKSTGVTFDRALTVLMAIVAIVALIISIYINK